MDAQTDHQRNAQKATNRIIEIIENTSSHRKGWQKTEWIQRQETNKPEVQSTNKPWANEHDHSQRQQHQGRGKHLIGIRGNKNQRIKAEDQGRKQKALLQ